MEVVASLSQGRTGAAQCGLFTHKSVPVIFEPPCSYCTGRFIMFFVIADNYNKETKGYTLMELFTATGKLKVFLFFKFFYVFNFFYLTTGDVDACVART